MAIMPEEAPWGVYAMLITLLTAFTVTVAFKERLSTYVRPVWQGLQRKKLWAL